MKFKKIAALCLAAAMVVSMVGCGSKDNGETTTDAPAGTTAGADESDDAEDTTPAESALEGTLTIWTLAKDLETMANKFVEENPGVTVDVTVIEPADYVTKTMTAVLGGDDSIDVIVGEPQMLEPMFEAGMFEDLNAMGCDEFTGDMVDYMLEVGQDADGVQRAISYQICPSGFYYRRDIAEKVFGYSDPESVGALFASYDTILETAQTLKDAGYAIFASDGELGYMSGDSAWVIDGVLNVDQARYDYMDLCVALYQGGYTTFASAWSSPWYAAMSGPVAYLTPDVNVWDETFDMAEYAESTGAESTEVFAFGLPSWGVLTMRDNYGDTKGQWGICSGPSYGFGGGTWLGISTLSQNKELAWEFIKWVVADIDTINWWIETSEGDIPAYIPALEAHKDDENEVYGGQKLFQFWLEQAEGIDYSKVTQYDTAIGNAWGAAISTLKTEEGTLDEALATFYDTVQSTYPEITINR